MHNGRHSPSLPNFTAAGGCRGQSFRRDAGNGRRLGPARMGPGMQGRPGMPIYPRRVCLCAFPNGECPRRGLQFFITAGACGAFERSRRIGTAIGGSPPLATVSARRSSVRHTFQRSCQRRPVSPAATFTGCIAVPGNGLHVDDARPPESAAAAITPAGSPRVAPPLVVTGPTAIWSRR